jgi:SAM-dependent methyltransferase
VPRGLVAPPDEGAVRALTDYYKQTIPDGSEILDICSSWYAHRHSRLRARPRRPRAPAHAPTRRDTSPGHRVSHYPDDFPKRMKRIVGTGMNANELEANKQLSDFTPKNLNIDPKLPYPDNSFDVVTCVVSVDYLIKPLEVFKEVRRVLRPGGRFILSQSNRCFPTKAIRMWLGMDDLQHCLVIGAYFHYSGGWAKPRAFDASPSGPNTNDPLFIVEARRE